MKKLLVLFSLIFLATACAVNNPDNNEPDNTFSVNPLFTDNMIIQRNAKSAVFGKASPDTELKVTIKDQILKCKADKNGKWLARIQPIPAGGPFRIVIEKISDDEKYILENVYAGDVWLCSGQSNMEMGVAMSENGKQEIKDADHPAIRLFNVNKNVSRSALDSVDGKWLVCSPENLAKGPWGGFSAVAYFFGRQLGGDLDVPMGLIQSAWGGTPAKSWISKPDLRKNEKLKHIVENFIRKTSNTGKKQKEYEKNLAEWKKIKKKYPKGVYPEIPNTGFNKNWNKKEFNDSTWKTMNLPQIWEKNERMNVDGAVWFRREFDIPKEWQGKALNLSLGPIDDMDVTYFNGTEIGSTGKETEDFWKQKRLYSIPSESVKTGKALIAIRVFDHLGAGGIYGAAKQMYICPKFSPDKKIPLAGKWKYKIEKALFPIARPTAPMGPDSPHSPSGLYNGMIHPLNKFAIKGVIWYQGESDVHHAYLYRELIKTLIQNWRKVWNQGDFPFLIVQLANFHKAVKTPGDSDWAELREAQNTALALAETGLAVTIDVGNADDIHPKDKQTVGYRLAKLAEKVAYGKDIVASGPSYTKYEILGDKIKLYFKNIGSGLNCRGKKLREFTIAGKDKVFHRADAEISGNNLIVSCPEVQNPLAVRYAWADNPEGANFYNKDGFPASPFRTDNWEGITEGNK